MFTTPEKVETMVVAINYVLLTTEKNGNYSRECINLGSAMAINLVSRCAYCGNRITFIFWDSIYSSPIEISKHVLKT
jgi:hypothetical protein